MLYKPTKYMAVTLAFIAFGSIAQEEGLAPSVELAVAHDDNVFRVSEQQSDSILSVAPKLQLTELYEKYRLDAQYQGNYQFYNELSDLNYTDHDALVRVGIAHTSRLSSEIALQYQDKVELPGDTNAATTALSEFNQTMLGRANIKLAYGTVQSLGQAVVAYEHAQRRYDNNQQFFRDYDSDKVTAQFFYRVAPKTRLVTQVSSASLSYQNAEVFDFSSQQNQYLLGVEWTATAKTTSVFKIGYQDVDYDNEAIADISGLSYFLDMYWKPNTYSLLQIGASRAARESAEQGLGGLISNRYEIRLQHELGSRIEANAQLSLIEEEFSGGNPRTDKKYNMNLKLSYEAVHWLNVYAGFTLVKRSSNVDIYDFDAQQYQLGLVASFN